MSGEDVNEFPYVYRRAGDEHLVIDQRDEHVVGGYEHLGIAVVVGAALNEEHQRQRTETMEHYEWCVMRDGDPTPHRPHLTAQEARKWVREWEGDLAPEARKGMFYVARRTVGPWERVET